MALKEGSRVFLRFDSPSRGRLLQLGIVHEVLDNGWTLAFEDRHRAVETGEEKLVYYDRGRETQAAQKLRKLTLNLDQLMQAGH